MKARRNVFLVLLFLGLSTLYSWVAAKYEWKFLPIWLQSLAAYLLPQLLEFWRTKVAKIGFFESFAIALGGKKNLLKMFEEEMQNTEK